MAAGGRTGIWARRLTIAAAVLSLGALAAALIAALGSGQGWWHFRPAFLVLRYAFFAAAAGGVLALIALILSLRARSGRILLNLLSLAAALGFVLYLGLQVRTAYSVPAIHDITTNLEDPPAFHRLEVRADNLENIPDLGDPALAALPPEERWKEVHRRAYGDLRTVRVPWDVEETVERARALAEERGWEVVTNDAARGILEFTDTTFFFRFKDDVAVRVRPDPAGGGALVDMRSISRVGVSDVGVNARRIRAFLEDLQSREP
jgi:hypothetical protein